jgi:SSS family solute:Na+ symporter
VRIDTLDLIIIIAYLVGIVGLGCVAGVVRRRRGDASGSGYFLAGKSLTWPVIGLALFSTNISTVHLVSLAQEGFDNGLAFGNFEWMAGFVLVILALFFAPFYMRARVATLPDFLERRYSRAARDWLAGMSIVSAIFIHIGFSLYAGAVVLNSLFGINILFSIAVVALLTGLYTIVGGLLAVVWTESIQTIILLGGAICIAAVAYVKIGYWDGLVASVEPVKLTMLRSLDAPPDKPWFWLLLGNSNDSSNLSWLSVFLGYPVIGIWYWCSDQTIVQRVLGAKDENHARVGPLFAGFIKILPVFIFVLPGLMCYGLISKGQLPDLADSSQTYSFMISHLLPIGLRGVVAAALLAALMSTVSGALNSIATLFSYDLYKRWRPDTSDAKLVTIGRIATFVAMLLAIAWSPMVGQFKTIFQGINAMICYIAPPITVVFVAGVFWRRASSRAAFVTLVAGSAMGVAVFFLDFYKAHTGWNLHWMMAGFYLAVVCCLILVVLSLLKPDTPSPERLALVWKTPLEAFRSPAWSGPGNYRFLAVMLVVVMTALYIVFN